MTVVDPECVFPARMSGLPQALDFVAACCDQHAVSRDDALRLALIVEELFTNTVAHGHGGDCDALVRIALVVDSIQVALSYADAAPPFDPLSGVEQATAEMHADLDARPIGHVGIPLVVQMAASVHYRHADGLNRLQVILRRR